MSGLYSNLPPAAVGSNDQSDPAQSSSSSNASSAPPAASWSGANKLVPPPRKREAPASGVAAIPTTIKRIRTATVATSSPLVAYEAPAEPSGNSVEASSSSPPPEQQDDAEQRKPTSPTTIATAISAISDTVPRKVVEYNPAQPNDYEEVLRERRAQQAMKRKQEEMEQRRRELRQHDEREGLTPLELTGDDAWRRRAILSGRSPDELPDAEPDPNEPEERKLSAAERMMKMMGWKEGTGLGKNESGITTPLMHKKVSQTTAQIVQSAPKPMAQPAPKKPAMAPPPKKPTKKLRGKPSEVILLRNMVGPGEVDEDLCKETEEECQEKYGGVLECKVFEVKEPGIRPQEAVRIFVKFSSIENAVKAAVDLDGRFFAGKMVCACFYDNRRYENGELEPDANEPEMPPEIFS